MIKVHFSIDKANKDKEGFAPIKGRINIDYKEFSKQLAKIKPMHWNSKQQRVIQPKPHEKENNHAEINSILWNFKNDAEKYFLDCQVQKVTITPELVKAYLKGEKKLPQKREKDFWEAYEEFLIAGALDKAPNTIRNRKTIKNKLQEFESETGYKLSFESINLEFFDKLKVYVLETKGHGFNYLSAITDKFKAFMTWSQERGHHQNGSFKKLSAPEKEGSIIYLTFEELKTLTNFDFDSPKHQKARDFFCFGCLTGFRYVDLNRLTKDNLADGSIRITTQKTNKEVTIPIIPEIQTIIDKYPAPHKLLPKFSDQKLRDYIKECCKLAEINTPTEWKTFEKNITKTEFRPKYELVGTHTARKTFINLAYSRGIPIETIKSITGITREKTLRRYLEVSSDSKKEKLTMAFGGL